MLTQFAMSLLAQPWLGHGAAYIGFVLLVAAGLLISRLRKPGPGA